MEDDECGHFMVCTGLLQPYFLINVTSLVYFGKNLSHISPLL